MKHLLHSLALRVTMLIALLVSFGSSGAWADDSSLTFTAACGGSGTADDGAVWTVTSDAAESTYESDRGIHYGTGKKAVQYLTLTTDDISGIITKIVVNASGSNSPTLSVTVGGASFDTAKTGITTSNAAYTFNGSAAGEIVVDLRKSSQANGALYVKSIVVTYSAPSGDETTTTIDYSGITNINKFVSTEAGSLSASVTYGSPASSVPAASVTWSGNNDEVATINASTGAVTLVGAGTVTFTASYAGVEDVYQLSSATYVMTVIDEDPSMVTVWSEDFSTYSSSLGVPSGGTYSYACVNGGSNTRLYDALLAGGESPELLVGSSSGTFTATIPLNGNYVGNMKLTYKTNGKSMTVSTTTTGVSGSGTFSTAGEHTVTFTGITTSTEEIVIKFAAGSDNVRLDDIVLKGKPAPTAPSFSSVAGDILKGSTVTLTADEGCTIYYTTDGTTPTDASTEYTGAITINAAQTIKAIAVDANNVSSKVVSATYTLLKPEVPEFSVAAKTFNTAFDMTISSASGTTLKYTTDGTDPSSSGAATAVASNSTTINIPTGADVTVKAIAILDGVESNVAEVTYDYDDRPTPTFTLSATSLDLKVNETSSAVALTTNSDGDVTFSCADAHVTLTGTGTSRTISANAEGVYTINVSTAATSNYLAGAGTITVNVTKKETTMDLATSFTSNDLYVTKSGSVTGTPKYNSSAIAGALVTYTSSDEKVATVAADGTVTYKKAGSTTITASYAGDTEYEECEASYNLDLVDTTPQEVEVDITFNNTFFGISAITSWKTGDPTSATGSTDNVSVTYDKGSSSYFYCNASQIRCYSGNSLTFSAPTGYVIISITFSSSTWNAATPSTGEMNGSNTKLWEGASNEVSFSWSSTSRIESAAVTLAETVTIGDAGYTTYVAKHDISFPVAVTAYIATATSSSTVTLTSKASVPEGTAVVVKGEAGTYALPTITTTPETVTGNLLQASDGNVEGNGSIYALANKTGGVGFYLVADGVTVPAGKAYLDLSGSGVKEFLGFNFDTETGITEAAQNTEGTENLFDLSGRRVNKAQKGLYIVNGKKVLVK